MQYCSELRCIQQFSGNFGLFYWSLVSFCDNLVPTKGMSPSDYKLAPSRVHDCQSQLSKDLHDLYNLTFIVSSIPGILGDRILYV